jgi:hypothetical protein
MSGCEREMNECVDLSDRNVNGHSNCHLEAYYSAFFQLFLYESVTYRDCLQVCTSPSDTLRTIICKILEQTDRLATKVLVKLPCPQRPAVGLLVLEGTLFHGTELY